MELFTWEYLASAAGAASAVTLLTQFAKKFKYFEKVDTQLLSYFVSLFVMYSAAFFTGTVTAPSAAIIPFNAIIIMLAANGTYETIVKRTAKKDEQ